MVKAAALKTVTPDRLAELEIMMLARDHVFEALMKPKFLRRRISDPAMEPLAALDEPTDNFAAGILTSHEGSPTLVVDAHGDHLRSVTPEYEPAWGDELLNMTITDADAGIEDEVMSGDGSEDEMIMRGEICAAADPPGIAPSALTLAPTVPAPLAVPATVEEAASKGCKVFDNHYCFHCRAAGKTLWPVLYGEYLDKRRTTIVWKEVRWLCRTTGAGNIGCYPKKYSATVRALEWH